MFPVWTICSWRSPSMGSGGERPVSRAPRPGRSPGSVPWAAPTEASPPEDPPECIQAPPPLVSPRSIRGGADRSGSLTFYPRSTWTPELTLLMRFAYYCGGDVGGARHTYRKSADQLALLATAEVAPGRDYCNGDSPSDNSPPNCRPLSWHMEVHITKTSCDAHRDRRSPDSIYHLASPRRRVAWMGWVWWEEALGLVGPASCPSLHRSECRVARWPTS